MISWTLGNARHFLVFQALEDLAQGNAVGVFLPGLAQYPGLGLVEHDVVLFYRVVPLPAVEGLDAAHHLALARLTHFSHELRNELPKQ
jgi:hypothetical protein